VGLKTRVPDMLTFWEFFDYQIFIFALRKRAMLAFSKFGV
jgi:hypothetical protein